MDHGGPYCTRVFHVYLPETMVVPGGSGCLDRLIVELLLVNLPETQDLEF